jgi:hypothetical protein
MKTETKVESKRKPMRSFQAWPENEHRLAIASRVGINVSELINKALKANLERDLKAEFEKLKDEMKMVRDGGFEPPTPTVSR